MDYQVLVIGSGFGGSVAALRLAQKGYRVGLIDARRRGGDPVAGALDVPADAYFTSGHWAGVTDWKAELTPHYDQAAHVTGTYLQLAGQAGVAEHRGIEVTQVQPLPHGGYQMMTRRPGPIRLTGRVFTASQVVLAAGSQGTQRLLRASKSAAALPRVSDQLGALTWMDLTADPRANGRQVVRELFGAPQHLPLLGGCGIGASAADGVVDAYHRVFGHAGLHIMDGSVLSADPGVDPALTIIAQTERAVAMWPKSGEPDPRPGLGAAYLPLVHAAR